MKLLCRYILAWMGFLGFMNVYFSRSGLAPKRKGETNSQVVFVLSILGVSSLCRGSLVPVRFR
jgi:hypothetical protein